MNQKIRQVALKSALLAGVCCILYSVSLTLLGENPFGSFKYMIAGIYALFFIGAMWHYRFKLNGGVLRGKEGVLMGLLINAFATTLYCIGIYVFLKFTGLGESAMDLHVNMNLAILEKARIATPEYMTDTVYSQTKDAIHSWDSFFLASEQIAFFMGAGFFNTILFSRMMSHKPQVK